MTVATGHSDVLILGGGVIGLTTALLLLRSGRSVTILERAEPGAGASSGNCGTITPSHVPLHRPGTVRRALRWMLKPDAPFYVAPRYDAELAGWLWRFSRLCNERDFQRVATLKAQLLLASRSRLAQLIGDEALDSEFVESGTLYVYRDAAAFAAAQADAQLLEQIGIPVQVLDAAASRQLEPALKLGVVGAHFHPGDARLRPDRHLQALVGAVQRLGGRIVNGEAVQGFIRNAGRLDAVVGSSGRWTANTTVLALGAWSPALSAQLGLKLPIQPGKGYSISYALPSAAPRIPLVLKERGVCVSPWGSGFRLGSTMEFSGYDDSLNPRRLAALERGAREYLDTPIGDGEWQRWSGWRPMVPDDLPIIGWAPGIDGLMLATGHGMLGVSLSAMTGQLVTELISGAPPHVDPSAMSVQRFMQ